LAHLFRLRIALYSSISYRAVLKYHSELKDYRLVHDVAPTQ
jgi:hypothetical protein